LYPLLIRDVSAGTVEPSSTPRLAPVPHRRSQPRTAMAGSDAAGESGHAIIPLLSVWKDSAREPGEVDRPLYRQVREVVGALAPEPDVVEGRDSAEG